MQSGTTSQFIVHSECEIVFKDQNNVTIKEFDIASLASQPIDAANKLSLRRYTEFDIDLFSEDQTTFNFEANQANKRGRSQISMKVFEPNQLNKGMIPKNFSRMNSLSKIDVRNLAKNTKVDEKTVNKDYWRANMLSKLNKEQIWLSPANKPKTH